MATERVLGRGFVDMALSEGHENPNLHVLIIGAGMSVYLHMFLLAQLTYIGVTGLLIAQGLKKVF